MKFCSHCHEVDSVLTHDCSANVIGLVRIHMIFSDGVDIVGMVTSASSYYSWACSSVANNMLRVPVYCKHTTVTDLNLVTSPPKDCLSSDLLQHLWW